MSREPEVPGGAEPFLIALAHAHAQGRARSRVRDDRTAIEARTDQSRALLSTSNRNDLVRSALITLAVNNAGRYYSR